MNLRQRLVLLVRAWQQIAHRDAPDKSKRSTLLTCAVQLLETIQEHDAHPPRRIMHPNPAGGPGLDIGYYRGNTEPLEPSTCQPHRQLPEPRRIH